MHKCHNNSVGNVQHLEQLVGDFFPFSQQTLGFDKPVDIIFQSDEPNSQRILGKTAYYDPSAMEVVLYVDGRHPKDIMRSLSHELVHHAQNCRGDFTPEDTTYEGYAQKNPHLRKMEREAYTKGNLIFRDYEDLIKTGKKDVDIDFSKSGEPNMSLKEWKNNELNSKLMKKWGLLRETKEATPELEERYNPDEPEASDPWSYERGAPSSKRHPRGHTDLSDSDPDRGRATSDWERRRNKEISARQLAKLNKREGKEEIDEGHEHSDDCGCPEAMEEGWGWRAEDADEESGLHKQSEVDPSDYTGQRDSEAAVVSALKKGRALEEDSEGEETYHYGEAEGHDEKELHDLVRRHATRSHIDALKRDMDYDEDHEDRRERGDHFREGQEEMEEASEPAPYGAEERHFGDDADTYIGPALGHGMKGLPKGKKRHVAGGHEGVADFIMPNKPKGKAPDPGTRVWDPRHLKTKTTKVPPVKVREGKISVREAKQITRRIIERIRKEGK